MNDVITLDVNYSTTRRVIKADSQYIAGIMKQSNKPGDKFEAVLNLPECEARKGEGGLRSKGYFKVGGLIIDHWSLRVAEMTCQSPNMNNVIASEARPESIVNHDTVIAGDYILKPLITVVTVVYNAEQLLEETILSVINQTYENIEYIIIDGGSSDDTLDIIKKYDHAIDYWVSEKDKGIYDAMNKAIMLSLGRYICFLNAGDTYNSNDALLKVTSCSNQGFDMNIYSCEYWCLNQLMYIHVPKGINKNEIMPHPSTFSKYKLFKEFGLFDLRYKIFADALWINEVKKNKKYSVHSDVTTKMICGGKSSVISSVFLLESYRFRRHSNGVFKSFFVGVVRPLLSVCISKVVGDRFLVFIKKIVNNEFYK